MENSIGFWWWSCGELNPGPKAKTEQMLAGLLEIKVSDKR